MSIAPNPKSPLDVAREYRDKHRESDPGAVPDGRYKVVDRVDPREPSTAHLTDAGTDRLLARAGAVKDTVEVSTAASEALKMYDAAKVWADGEAASLIKTFQISDPSGIYARLTSVTMMMAYIRGSRDGSKSSQDIYDRAFGPTAPTVPTDLGDGLGLPLVSVGPGPIGSATQTEIPAAKPTCRTCGRTTLGADECGYCKYDRHNDDDAQRAAQERADAEDATT